MKQLKNWLKKRFTTDSQPAPPNFRRTEFYSHRAQHVAPPKADAKPVELDTADSGQIEDAGPGKNVLIRNKFVREDTGTHETLKILDDSLVDSGEETGIDPYNTGGFDRSKNWNNRFRD